MDTRYNVYFAGQILEGHSPEQVRQHLGRLFKAGEETLDKLFSGRAQLLKRDCDHATAQKYQQAMEQAGALAIVRLAAAADAAAADAPAAEPPAAAPAPPPAGMTMAERVAALAGADSPAPSPGGAEPPTEPVSVAAVRTNPAADTTAELVLTPPGTEVLRPHERSSAPPRQVDTSALSLAASGSRLSNETPPAPPAPDTAHLSLAAGGSRLSEQAPPPPPVPDPVHLSLAEAGEPIPQLASEITPLEPDLSGIELSPAGTDFSDCAATHHAAPELDLSHLALSPDSGRSKH